MKAPTRLQRFVEDWILPLLLIGLLGAAGCRGVSPERQAYRATATTITTATAALDVWFAHVNSENVRLANLKNADPAAFMEGRRRLVLAEGKVAAAWDTYVAAQKAIILGASAFGPGESPKTSDIKALETGLIELVKSLTR